MITVSIKQLVDAIEEAEVFKLPDTNAGTEYIYINIYLRLLHGEDVKLSKIDWDAFELDDINSFNKLYSSVFERNGYTADGIMSTLRNIVPISKAVGYV